ncbi:hypothetical protein MRX96_028863 [Rhipicephalus microplus]
MHHENVKVTVECLRPGNENAQTMTEKFRWAIQETCEPSLSKPSDYRFMEITTVPDKANRRKLHEIMHKKKRRLERHETCLGDLVRTRKSQPPPSPLY